VEIPEGFTKWEGGIAPFVGAVRVKFFCRNGAGPLQAQHDNLRWDHAGEEDDIIAYRIIEASDVEEAERIDGSSALVSSPGEGEEKPGPILETESDPVLRAFEDDQIIAPAPLIDAQTCEAVDPRVSWDAKPGPHPEDASVFADDPAPEGYAPVVAVDVPVPATFFGEGYELGYKGADRPSDERMLPGYEMGCADRGSDIRLGIAVPNYDGTEPAAPEAVAEPEPATNPEADAIAGAHDYYSPQAQARREREESVFNRFNPFRVKADA
jgi:hypothetical protein